MSGSYTGFPIANVNIPSLPDLGGVTDASMLVGERAGTGRFAATGLRDYVMTTVGASYATTAYVDAADVTKLPLTGGTLTGNLSIPDTLFFTGSGMSFNVSANFCLWTFDPSNYEIAYTRANGLLQYRRGDGVELWSVDAVGNSKISGDLTIPTGNLTVTAGSIEASGTIGSNGLIAALGDIYARGGHYYFGNADQAVLSTTVAGTSLRFSADGWALSWNASTGTLGYINNSALAVFTVDSSGNGTFLGAVHGTNVTLLEDKVAELQARIADLQETLTTRIAALEAQMAAPRTAD
jgi:hypothetical protein